jgi:hypothetical protein
MGRARAELMNRLGYTRYVAEGGDRGALVVDQMGVQAPAGLLAIHTNTTSATGELTRDEILDNITLYWLTNPGVSASRLYWAYKGGFFNAKGVSIPVAVTVFPGEQYEAPRSWTERASPGLIYYNRAEKGGHFAAWEQPMIFARELRAALGSLREGR